MFLTYILFSTMKVFQQNGKKNDSKNRLRNACQRTVSLFVLQLKTTDDFVEIKSNQDQRCLDF